MMKMYSLPQMTKFSDDKPPRNKKVLVYSVEESEFDCGIRDDDDYMEFPEISSFDLTEEDLTKYYWCNLPNKPELNEKERLEQTIEEYQNRIQTMMMTGSINAFEATHHFNILRDSWNAYKKLMAD